MSVQEKIGTIKILQIADSTNLNQFIGYGQWKNSKAEINYTKYQIKETDMRVKTASFTSPDYIDLTTGQYAVRISSIYHENFSGIILDVEYDPDTALYTYQCQDWSRKYMAKIESMTPGLTNIYNLLIIYLTNLEITKLRDKNNQLKSSYTSSDKSHFKSTLSGLKPLSYYDQSLYDGNKYTGNPFKKKPKMIVRDKTLMEIMRSLVFGSLGFFDVWFNERGILQIEPISKKDWEKTGLHLTTGAAMKEKYKFSTTNAITRAYVNGSGTTAGGGYNLDDLKSGALDLTMFFGRITSSISDPTNKNTTSAASSTSNSTKTNTSSTSNTKVNTDNPYGTKNKEVWLNSDRIYGNTTDVNFMKNVAKHLEKAGWKTHVYGHAYSEAHYQHRPGCALAGQVKNGIWFTIYGGVCAGTLRETANTSYFRKPLIDRGSRTVVGFLRPPAGDIRKGGKYYSYLPRAHDDGFSGGDPYIRNCAQYLTDHAIPFCYGKNAKELAEEFLAGGYNKEACTKDWKFYNKGGFLSGGR